MNSMKTVLLEQVYYINLIFRLAVYEIKGMYQIHYLGVLWQILNPTIQVTIYWFVFGLGIRGGQPVGEIPFFIWLLVGLIPWFFISPSIIQGSNSIYSKVSLVSKMKFPISVLPTIRIFSNSFQFVFMLLFLMIILMVYGVNPGWYIIQLPYYLVCLYIFLFCFTLLSSTIATLIRDYQMLLQSLMRMLLYLTPILWDTSRLPQVFENILKLNPFFYIIEGFRNTIFAKEWFFQDPVYAIYFWLLTFVILYFGSRVHLKFRDSFVDYL
ncbi:ABC transporter permease [Bacillus salacetis]|uniref:Transport permease protein n=1 Tax=Bacillus salacetis TaxID=2315464 RepID=A0A3A1QW83_9BACI|nr:ABC transporter permease [Bacillus salacetis]RIW31878.1 ABC transporter permease [Bacillus salacetis]